MFDYCLTNISKSIMYELSTATWATFRFSFWCIVKKIIRWTRYQLRKKMLSQDSWYASVCWRPIKTTSQTPFMVLWKEILNTKSVMKIHDQMWQDQFTALYCYKDVFYTDMFTEFNLNHFICWFVIHHKVIISI